jgi:3-methyladenine DNA glycosylase AlkD
MWLRRCSIIAQLQSGAALDTTLLYSAIGANLLLSRFGKEFFIQKAVGWALRQRARIAAPEVTAFVAKHGASLGSLSKREALKHLAAGGQQSGKKRVQRDSVNE